MNDEKINEHIEKYKPLKSKYHSFSESIYQLLEQLLKSANIKFQQVTYREKEIDKLKEKYQKNPDLINKQLEEVNDLAGCRVIFYFEEQILQFIEVLKKEFKFMESPKRKIDPAGYNATHVIIALDERRSSLAEYSDFSGLICEIQLTTVLFHSWSEINHDIIYKKEEGVEDFSKEDMRFIEEKLKEIMQNYIWKASYNLSFVNSQYERLKKGMVILNIDTMKSISESNSNEDILNYIIKLNNFSGFYKLPKEFEFLDILDKLLIKALENNSTSGLKIIEASFDFIKNIVYWDYKKIIKFCIERIDKAGYKESCEKVLLELSKYNLNVVRFIGYDPQKSLIEKIMGAENKEQFTNFLIKICKNLLTTSLEGTSQNEFNSLTITMGPIWVNQDLKEIRKKAIDFLFNSLDENKDCEFNESIINILFSSIKTHHQNIRKEDLDSLRSDVKYILTKIKPNYSSLKNCLKRQVDIELKYPDKQVFNGIEEVEELIKLINEDEEYQKFKTFVGYETDYGGDWKTVEKERKDLLDKFVSDISETNVDEWTNYIKTILKDYSKKDYPLFQNLHYFLNEVGKKKSEVGDKFKSIQEIKDFQVSLLCGLLESNKKEEHYNEIKEWIGKSERLLDIAITFRFFTNYDEDTFSNLVDNSIQKGDINQLIEILLTVCKNYKCKKSKISQFIKIIKKFTENDYFDWPQRVSFMMEDISKDFSKEDYKIILGNLVNKKDIGYDTEKILMNISEKHPEEIISFFHQRVKLSKSGENLIDSIPYKFQIIQEQLSKNIDIIVPKILEWLKEDDWKYKWEGGHLFNIIFPTIDNKFKEILISIVKEKDLDKLNSIFWILDKYRGNSDVLNIVHEIIKNFKVTNKIRNRLFSILSQTGVVTGEYGLANAYKNKIEEIKLWLSDENSEVVKFTQGYINYLENAIKYEKARVDQELDLMKSEFQRVKGLNASGENKDE